MEEWKIIKGFDRYQVSSKGRVKSMYDQFGRHRELILTPIQQSTGYYAVSLCNNGKISIKSIHRLVAEAFIPNPNEYPIVNHKDETRTNNSVENLEWCTCKYNINYGNARKKLSNSMLGNTNGKHITEVGREKLRQINKGKHLSDDARQKLKDYWSKRREEKNSSRIVSE